MIFNKFKNLNVKSYELEMIKNLVDFSNIFYKRSKIIRH